MQETDFPALYRAADTLSLSAQGSFFRALYWHLICLIAAAMLSVANVPTWWAATAQVVVLLIALTCSIYLWAVRPDRKWYAGRAVAESIKTVTWRYVSRSEPFDNEDAIARSEFGQKLKAIVEQNREVAKELTTNLVDVQITEAMSTLRSADLEGRRNVYAQKRIVDQLTWYANKSNFNKKQANKFFVLLIGVNGIAVLFALLRIRFPSSPFWPTDVLVAAAASLISWMQAKRFSELAASYALAAHEISLIREQIAHVTSNEAFSGFVGDAENAFSREHTQWVARRDA